MVKKVCVNEVLRLDGNVTFTAHLAFFADINLPRCSPFCSILFGHVGRCLKAPNQASVACKGTLDFNLTCIQVTVMLRGRGVILSRGALSSVGQFVSMVNSTVTDCEAMLAGLSKEHPAYYAYMRPSLLDMHTLLDQMARQVDFFAPLDFSYSVVSAFSMLISEVH